MKSIESSMSEKYRPLRGGDISGYTNLLCLLGHPARHSLSPKMHNEACSLLGLDYVYLAFDVLPEVQARDMVWR